MHHFAILSLTVLTAGLSGCELGTASTLPVTSTSYELVTVARPENVDALLAPYRADYERCALTRKMLKLPPPAPMLRLPAEFISQRNTYTSDGNAYLTRQEFISYKMEASGAHPPTCKTYLETSLTTQLIRNGKMYNAGIDADGKRYSEPPSGWMLLLEQTSNIFPVQKIVKGHPVKCLDIPAPTKDLITALCVTNLKPGTLTDAQGDPLVVYSRVTDGQKLMGVVVTEPVSMRVGQPVDQTVFEAAAAR